MGPPAAEPPHEPLADDDAAAAPAPEIWSHATSPDAPPIDPLPADVGPLRGEELRLSNGMTVFLVPQTTGESVAALVAVRAGAAQDPPDYPGTAHLVEHMLDQGTTRLGTLSWEEEAPWREEEAALLEALTEDPREPKPLRRALRAAQAEADQPAVPNEFAHAMAAIGGTASNAFTGLEVTAFHAMVPVDGLEPWAHLMAEQLSDPVWRGFTNERRIVQHEVRGRDAKGHMRGDTSARRRLFGTHPYGNPVGGTIDGLAASHPGVLEAFWSEHYVASNMAVVLVGRLDVPWTMDVLEETFGQLRPGRGTPSALPPVLDWSGSAHVRSSRPGQVAVLWPTGPLTLREAAGLEVFLGRAGIRLPEGFRLTGINVARHRQTAWLGAYVTCPPRRQGCLDTVVNAVQRTLRRPSASERRMRAAEIAGLVRRRLRALESHEQHAQAIARAWSRGEALPDAASALAAAATLTTADVHRIAKEKIRPRSYVASIPELARRPMPPSAPAEPIRVNDAAASAFYDELATWPRRGPAPEWLVEGRDVTLAGGVLAVANPHNHLFAITYVYPRGWADDPELCMATYNVRSSDSRWAYELYRDGIDLDAIQCDAHQTRIRLAGSRSTLRRAMAAINEMPDHVELRMNARQHRALANLIPDLQAAQNFAMWGGGSPSLALPPEKPPSTERLAASIRAMLQQAPTVLYFGPHTAEQVSGRVTSAPPPPPRMAPGPWPEGTTIIDSERSGLQGYRPLPRDLDDQAGLELLYALWLEGRSGAWFDQVRTRTGSAYGAHAELILSPEPVPTVVHLAASKIDPGRQAEVATLLAELMGTTRLDDAAWQRLQDKRIADRRQRHIDARGVPWRAFQWWKRGPWEDRRALAHDEAERITRDAFEAFLEESATQPLFIEIDVKGDAARATLERLGPVRAREGLVVPR